MFYSTEILTSRKYGVATVWLVATLGSHSNLKKVTRKAIIDVDVQKACETISEPEAPLALRLQSNLLYGVARVYAQQCGYVLHDAEAAKSSMRAVFKTAQVNTLAPNGALKGRPDQLMLQDDPNFLPDFNLMPVDLDQLEHDRITPDGSQRGNLSPYGSEAGRGSSHFSGGLVLPQLDSSFGGGLESNFEPFGRRGDLGPGSGTGGRYKHAELLDDDLGLSVDPDGDVLMEGGHVAASTSLVDMGGNTDPVSVDVPSGQDHGHHNYQNARSGDLDHGFVPNVDDDLHFGLLGDVDPHASRDSHHSAVLLTTSETADAPIRRRARAPLKVISVDNTIELRNSDLARWGNEYAANMRSANQHKDAQRAIYIAKKNAEYWVTGTGISSLDRRADHGSGAFLILEILENLLDVRIAAPVLKRSRSNDDIDISRRVRSRQGSLCDEVARDAIQDDYVPTYMDDDTIEQGREAPTPLNDHRLSTAFPWNSGSQRPSNLLSAGGLPTSTGSRPFMPISRRGSRLISHSPLENHGFSGVHMDMDELQLPGSEMQAGLTSEDEFELYGPAANVDTQTAAQSQWQRSILEDENANFLAFVQTGIDEADRLRAMAPPGDEEDEQLTASVDFETLLPPHSNSTIVAAQALLHALALGTKSLLRLQQREAFGPISMSAFTAA